MIARRLIRDDVERDRLRELIKKRVSTVPAVARLDVHHVYSWLIDLLTTDPEAVLLVADDGGEQLQGLFVARPTYLIGSPVPVMGDLLVVATSPKAMPLLVAKIETIAKTTDCKSILLTCEAQSTEAAKRWGSRYGARLVAMSLFKEV